MFFSFLSTRIHLVLGGPPCICSGYVCILLLCDTKSVHAGCECVVWVLDTSEVCQDNNDGRVCLFRF